MPYSCIEKIYRCWIHLLYLPALFISLHSAAQSTWTGKTGDGQWNTSANWSGNVLPKPTDDVSLDNSLLNNSYTVFLPAGITGITVRSITIDARMGNKIRLVLPASNTAEPALTTTNTGHGYGITISNDGALINSSGNSSGMAIVINDSFRINNGGQYIHNTRSAHGALASVLSTLPGTETGVFYFDVPGGGYTFATTGRTYGTLVLSAEASGGSQVYATSAASPLTVNGDFFVKTGVTANFDLTSATTIKGNYIQEGGVFNLASQPNNNVIYIKGDFIQTAGAITETSTGLPAIELNGTVNQNIRATGSIVNSVDFRINNNAGVSLASVVTLPYNLSLISGIVNSHSFLITLLNGCSLHADSLSNNSFINGPLRKEGLVNAANFLFPVGKAITQRWVALKNVSGNYTVEFFKANPYALATTVGTGIHHISTIEYWSVQADAFPAPATKVELSFDNVNSGGVTDMSALRVAQMASGTWEDRGNTATTGTPGSSGSVVSIPVNSFEPGKTYFSLGSSDAFQNPLPLKILLFNGNIDGGTVVIRWRLTPEWQPGYFELESSQDGIHFNFLSKIDVITNQVNYQYTDKRKFTGKQFYRLKSVATDGSSFYTTSLKLFVHATTAAQIQLGPSLVRNNANLSIAATGDDDVPIRIYNMDGKIVQAMHVFVQAGSNSVALQTKALTAGIYIVAVQLHGKIIYSRFIKTN